MEHVRKGAGWSRRVTQGEGGGDAGWAGSRLKVPVLVAPMSKHKMAHPEGELASVRAAAAEGFGMASCALSPPCLRCQSLRSGYKDVACLDRMHIRY